MKNITVLILALLYSFSIWAQKPTEVPKPSEEPIDLSNPADIIIYIVLPICAILFFIIWKRKQKKQK